MMCPIVKKIYFCLAVNIFFISWVLAFSYADAPIGPADNSGQAVPAMAEKPVPPNWKATGDFPGQGRGHEKNAEQPDQPPSPPSDSPLSPPTPEEPSSPDSSNEEPDPVTGKGDNQGTESGTIPNNKTGISNSGTAAGSTNEDTPFLGYTGTNELLRESSSSMENTIETAGETASSVTTSSDGKNILQIPDTTRPGEQNQLLEGADTDGDGIPNSLDPDIDGDGFMNWVDGDIDGDGIANTRDLDIDGDGIPNNQDTEMDKDGITNERDSDIDGDGIPNTEDPDMDGDGIPNVRDLDMDGDGIPNNEDPDVDGDFIANDKDTDMDGDGIANTEDPDMDADGIANESDATPHGFSK